jgi:hypothetical protein
MPSSLQVSASTDGCVECTCNCVPTQISFHLEFGGDCDNINLAGAAEVMSCNRGAFPANLPNVNLVPVQIKTIIVSEFDKDNPNLNKKTKSGTYSDGDTFSFTPLANDNSDISRGMMVDLHGVNADGQTIRNLIAMNYTNNCYVRTFEEEDHISWIVVVSLFRLNT